MKKTTRKIFASKAFICAVTLSIVGFTGTAKAGESFYSLAGQIKILAVNPSKNWIKLYNSGDLPVDLAGWVMYDDNDNHEFFVTKASIINGELILVPRSETTVSVKYDSDFSLNDEGGKIRLFSGPLEMEGVLQDEVNYRAVDAGVEYNQNEVVQDIAPYDAEQGGSGFKNQNSMEEIRYETPEGEQFHAITLNDDEKDGPEDLQAKDEEKNSDKEKEADNSLGSKEDDKDTSTEQETVKSENFENTPSFNQKNSNSGLENPDNNAGFDANAGDKDYPAFTASSSLEKSPYAWFYWLQGSWFLWKVIIPFLSLWAILYISVNFIRKKYLS